MFEVTINTLHFQEDYSTGKVLKTVLQSDTENMQVLCNTACLIANLATSQEDQVNITMKQIICKCCVTQPAL